MIGSLIASLIITLLFSLIGDTILSCMSLIIETFTKDFVSTFGTLNKWEEILGHTTSGADAIDIATAIDNFCKGFGLFLVIFLIAFGLIRNMLSGLGFSGESTFKLVIRGLGAGTSVFLIKDIFVFIYDNVFSAILGNLTKADGGIFGTIADPSAFSNIWGTVSFELVHSLLFLFFAIILVKGMLELIIEFVERYLLVCVLVIFSPLAVAAITLKTTMKIFSTFLKMFFSHMMLLIISGISVSLLCQTLNWALATINFHGGFGVDFLEAYLPLIIVYAFLRIVKRMDNYLKDVGLTLGITGGDITGDMFAAAKTLSAPLNIAKKGGGKIADGVNSKIADTKFGQTKLGQAMTGKAGSQGQKGGANEKVAGEFSSSNNNSNNAMLNGNTAKSQQALNALQSGAKAPNAQTDFGAKDINKPLESNSIDLNKENIADKQGNAQGANGLNANGAKPNADGIKSNEIKDGKSNEMPLDTNSNNTPLNAQEGAMDAKPEGANVEGKDSDNNIDNVAQQAPNLDGNAVPDGIKQDTVEGNKEDLSKSTDNTLDDSVQNPPNIQAGGMDSISQNMPTQSSTDNSLDTKDVIAGAGIAGAGAGISGAMSGSNDSNNVENGPNQNSANIGTGEANVNPEVAKAQAREQYAHDLSSHNIEANDDNIKFCEQGNDYNEQYGSNLGSNDFVSAGQAASQVFGDTDENSFNTCATMAESLRNDGIEVTPNAVAARAIGSTMLDSSSNVSLSDAVHVSDTIGSAISQNGEVVTPDTFENYRNIASEMVQNNCPTTPQSIARMAELTDLSADVSGKKLDVPHIVEATQLGSEISNGNMSSEQAVYAVSVGNTYKMNASDSIKLAFQLGALSKEAEGLLGNRDFMESLQDSSGNIKIPKSESSLRKKVKKFLKNR